MRSEVATYSQSQHPTRPWDGYDAYLFDIDGTLLHASDAVHYFAFCEALTGVAGRPVNLDGITVHGNTDVGILRDALARAGIGEQRWRPQLPRIRAGMCEFVAARARDLRIEVLPGVVEVLDRLQASGAKLGVATGNLEGIGRAKLGACGLLERFHFAGWSDEYEFRADVFGAALATARLLSGQDASVCVVGDTPEDVRAASANGLDVIAVASGIYPYEALLAASPTFCLRSLSQLVAESDAKA